MRSPALHRSARRAVWIALAGVAFVAAACSNDNNNNTGPTPVRTYNQLQRLGNPLVSEVFLEKRDHPFHGSIGPEGDVAAFGDKVKAFPTAFGRPAVVGNTLAAVLLPDMLIVQTDKDPSTSGWLTWALADGYGGRNLSDDVVDAGLSAIFGTIVSADGKLCDNGQLPLCTDNVGSSQTFATSFPYLNAPN